MGLQPKIEQGRITFKQCVKCGGTFGSDSFAPTKSLFCDGTIPLCDSCVDEFLKDDDSWERVDKLCQFADIPFIPKEWINMKNLAATNTFHKYAEVFKKQEYLSFSWKDYNEKYNELRASGKIASELPLLDEEERSKYRERWGIYDDEGYQYLENLYKGVTTTQNINGALQVDQAIKICKISYEIDKRIEEGIEFDKLLSSYDKLVKAADLTPKNVKNINDFDTIGELALWMEKNGWHNSYYDNVSRDVVDETMMNIQNFNRRLYINESGIGDDITHRIEMLKTAKTLENDNYYGTDLNADLDNYDNNGYERLMGEEEEFKIDMENNDE